MSPAHIPHNRRLGLYQVDDLKEGWEHQFDCSLRFDRRDWVMIVTSKCFHVATYTTNIRLQYCLSSMTETH